MPTVVARFAPLILGLAACTVSAEPVVPAGDTKNAEGILAKSALAYQAVALEDEMSVEVLPPGGAPAQRMSVQYAFGRATDAKLRMPGLQVTALDGHLYLVRDDVADKYIDVPLQGDLAQTLNTLLGENASLPVSFDLRAGRGVPAYLQAIGLNLLNAPQIESYQRVERAGREVHEIVVAGVNGRSTATIDGQTLLLHRIEIEATPDGAPAGPPISAVVMFNPKITKSSDGLIAFDATGRSAVTDIRSLVPTALRVGDVAPDFTLAASDGTTVTLSSLRGKVVVLDFWATWCAPCRRGLPYLQKFYDWTITASDSVAVYAVDCFERAPDAEAKKAKGLAFWTAQKFTMPTLFDVDDRTVNMYGISRIPTTLVIGPDGTVKKIHRGFDPKMDETLKADVATIFGSGS